MDNLIVKSVDMFGDTVMAAQDSKGSGERQGQVSQSVTLGAQRAKDNGFLRFGYGAVLHYGMACYDFILYRHSLNLVQLHSQIMVQ